MKAKLGIIMMALVFLSTWAAADVGAAPPDFNDLFDECPGNACGAPPTGGAGGGGGGGGILILVYYTWGPLLSVQEDIDGDGYNDEIDNCMFTPNDPSQNADGDTFGDECDLCPDMATENNDDLDHDGAGDDCDPDIDNDGVEWIPGETPILGEPTGIVDRCPYQKNLGIDTDGDGIDDVCDTDDDDDGIPDLLDNCVNNVNPNQENQDHYINGDISGDACDDDYDNDQLDEPTEDLCANLQSEPNGDADDDGVGDPCDNCPRTANPDQLDANQDGRGDECDV